MDHNRSGNEPNQKSSIVQVAFNIPAGFPAKGRHIVALRVCAVCGSEPEITARQSIARLEWRMVVFCPRCNRTAEARADAASLKYGVDGLDADLVKVAQYWNEGNNSLSMRDLDDAASYAVAKVAYFAEPSAREGVYSKVFRNSDEALSSKNITVSFWKMQAIAQAHELKKADDRISELEAEIEKLKKGGSL